MLLIQPNCRIQFTCADMDFILETLRPGLDSKDSLECLLADPETRDTILDDETIYQAVLEHRGCLKVSAHFYFYILVRQVFRKAGLQDRLLADYVAEMLAEFSQTHNTQLRLEGQQPALDYFCDMLAALQSVDDITRFYIRAHMGNASLFLTGIFPDRIRHRAERRGAPGLSYYEAMGRTSFSEASDHRLARHYELSGVYTQLARRFPETRAALNDLGERLVALGDPDYSPLLKTIQERN